MSPKLRHLSGKEVVSVLVGFGFFVVSQRGSHAKLRRMGPAGQKETLTVPMHDELDLGTLRAVFRHASRYIAEDELRSYFYTE